MCSIEYIRDDIVNDTCWSHKKEYIIIGEIHVRAGATLTIKKNTIVQFKNGLQDLPSDGSKSVPLSCLIVDTGAALIAKNVLFYSNSISGGIVVLGRTTNPIIFENYTSIVTANIPTKLSIISSCTFNNLGSQIYDFNSLSLFYCSGPLDIQITNLSIIGSGDDGLEIYGGNHTIDVIVIRSSNPAADDGIDLDNNATLTITKLLELSRLNAYTASNVLGAGLLEVTGTNGTTNTIILKAGAAFNFNGLTLDKPVTTNTGAFSTWAVNKTTNQISITGLDQDSILQNAS